MVLSSQQQNKHTTKMNQRRFPCLTHLIAMDKWLLPSWIERF